MTGPRYTCVPGEPPKLSEVYVDRVVKARWDEPTQWRQPIMSSDALALEAVARYQGMWRDPLGEAIARQQRRQRAHAAQLVTEMFEEGLYGKEALRALRADQTVVRAAGQRAVVRYAHEVRSR